MPTPMSRKTPETTRQYKASPSIKDATSAARETGMARNIAGSIPIPLRRTFIADPSTAQANAPAAPTATAAQAEAISSTTCR